MNEKETAAPVENKTEERPAFNVQMREVQYESGLRRTVKAGRIVVGERAFIFFTKMSGQLGAVMLMEQKVISSADANRLIDEIGSTDLLRDFDSEEDVFFEEIVGVQYIHNRAVF